MLKVAPVVGLLLAVTLLGCGGGSSSMQGAMTQAVDAKLAKLGAPSKQIACVNRNIAKMTSEQIAERVVEPAPADAGEETIPQYLGRLGKGCP